MRSEKPGLPILVVCASAYPEIRKAFMREGALDYIVKPFAASSFELVCNRLVGMFPELVRVGSRPASVAPDPIEVSETLADRGN
jgi:DNA-binding NtrC family response regulator